MLQVSLGQPGYMSPCVHKTQTRETKKDVEKREQNARNTDPTRSETQRGVGLCLHPCLLFWKTQDLDLVREHRTL